MFKIAFYELKKLIRDHRWMAIFLAQPVLIVTLLGSVAIHDPKNISVLIYDTNQNQYSREIAQVISNDSRLKIVAKNSENDLRESLRRDEATLGVLIKIDKEDQIRGKIEVVENSTAPEMSARSKVFIADDIKPVLDGFTKNNAKTVIGADQSQKFSDSKNALSRIRNQVSSIPLDQAVKATMASDFSILQNQSSAENIEIDTSKIDLLQTKNTSKSIKYFDFYASALIVLLILLVGINTSSTTVTQERIDGTFERFFVTPYSKTHMIIGKMLAFVTVSVVLALLTIFSLKLLFDVTLGPIFLVLLITFLTSLCALSLGLLISSFTYTIAESIQVGITLFFSILILCGLIFQPETMHAIPKFLHQIIPFTYSVRAMREVNLLNFNFSMIGKDLLILVGYTALFLTLSVLFLRRKAD